MAIDPFVEVVEFRLLWLKVGAVALTMPEDSTVIVEETVPFCGSMLDIRVGAGEIGAFVDAFQWTTGYVCVCVSVE